MFLLGGNDSSVGRKILNDKFYMINNKKWLKASSCSLSFSRACYAQRGIAIPRTGRVGTQSVKRGMGRVYFFLFSLLALLLLSACGTEQGTPSHQTLSGLTPLAPKADVSLAQGKTFFSFSAEENIVLQKEETQTITVAIMPTYDPVSSVEIGLLFDPNKLILKNITPVSDTIFFSKEINTEKGEMHIIAALPGGKFGSKIDLFTFEASKKEVNFLGESRMMFLPEKTKALLADDKNTDTAVKEDLPILVFSMF